MNAKRRYSPLPLVWYVFPLACIVLIALSDAAYLAVSHYRNYTDISYQSFCALSKAMNCDTVSQSSHAIFLSLPVSVWGILAYLFYGILFVLACIGKSINRYWGMLSFIGIIYSFYSVYLALISNFVIGSYCIMCIGLYLTNLLMGFYPWLIYNRFGTETFFTSLRIDLISLFKNKPFKNLLSGFMILIFVVLIFFPRYWETAFPGITAQVFTGTTEEGSPWIGAEHPELIIVEYTDYMCFQCKKMHFFLRNLVMEYPAKIRLVHRHFPLDKQVNPLVMKDFHPGSGVLSQIAIYAEKKHKFWQLNDYLYNLNLSHGAISLKKIALDNGFEFLVFKKGISSLETSQKLTLDIISALKKNISGTPSYIINGKKFTGQIPPEVLRPIIQ